MIPVLSVVTSVKDYLEVVHKLIEYDSESISFNTHLRAYILIGVLFIKFKRRDLTISLLKYQSFFLVMEGHLHYYPRLL